MKNVNPSIRKVISAAAAAAVISSLGIVSYADGDAGEYDTYSPDNAYTDNSSYPAESNSSDHSYSTANIAVTGSNLSPNVDNGEKLSFSITNISGGQLTFMTFPTNGAVQEYTEDGKWTNISGEHGKEPSFDDLTPEEIYSNYFVLNSLSEYSCSMDVSFLKTGEYRMKLYIVSGTGYSEEYVYFAVKENISATADDIVFTNEPVFNFSVKNDLPIGISAKFSENLKLERYSDGEWVDSEVNFSSLTKKVTVESGKTAKMNLSFNGISKFVPGQYRMSLELIPEEDKSSENGEVSGTKTIVLVFTVKNPVTAEVMEATVTSRDNLYVPLKVINNTNDTITVEKYGRLQRNSNKRWVDVAFKNKAKEIDSSVTLEPGEEKVIKIYLSDYYRTGRLSIGIPYKMSYTAGGKEYFIGFELYEGIIRTDKYNSSTDEYYYIIKECEI